MASVCYRGPNPVIEFLLVQTRKGRWTFPKGGVESGLTHAESAALEAFEEAGVHGRIEKISFARYVLRKPDKTRETDSSETRIHCHLCEVLRLDPPQESNRNPTWLHPEKAKRFLREGRTSDNGAELARIVDRAVARIRRFRNGTALGNDPLQRVQFEAFELGVAGLMSQGAFHARRDRKAGQVGHLTGHSPLRGKLLRLGPGSTFNK